MWTSAVLVPSSHATDRCCTFLEGMHVSILTIIRQHWFTCSPLHH